MIVYLSDDNIYMYDVKMKTSRQIATYNSPGGIKYPSFSPSGNYILFTALSQDGEGTPHLVIHNLRDSTYIKVSHSDYTMFPMWTNEENKIAFFYDRDLWIKNIEDLLH